MSASESVWRLILAVGLCIAFAIFGLLHLVTPRRFMNRYPFNTGGELLRAWNKLGLRVFGAVLLEASTYVICSIAADAGRFGN